jgi:hypothetical protein
VNDDFVSDLNSGADEVIPASTGTVDTQRGTEPAVRVEEAPKTDTQEKANKPTSLRDQLSSALKDSDTLTPDAATQGERPRNPDGTYASKPVDAPQADPNTALSAPQNLIQAPQGMSPQEAEVFAKLPAELQTSVARTMESLNEKAARFAGYEQMEQLISPRRQAWAMNGMTEAQAVNQLLALSDFATTKPAEFIQYFAQNNGVDLEALVYDQDPTDPKYAQLEQQVQTLTSQLSGMTAQQQQAAHQSTIDEIVSFASEAGTDGKPLRPYFEELGTSVLPFIQTVREQNPNMSRVQVLQEAYDRACWGMPSVRAKMQEASAQADRARQIREQQDVASRARRAGTGMSSGVPTTSSADAVSGVRSLRDELRASIASAS